MNICHEYIWYEKVFPTYSRLDVNVNITGKHLGLKCLIRVSFPILYPFKLMQLVKTDA